MYFYAIIVCDLYLSKHTYGMAWRELITRVSLESARWSWGLVPASTLEQRHEHEAERVERQHQSRREDRLTRANSMGEKGREGEYPQKHSKEKRRGKGKRDRKKQQNKTWFFREDMNATPISARMMASVSALYSQARP